MLLPHYPVTTKTTTNTLGTHPVEFAGIEIEKKNKGEVLLSFSLFCLCSCVFVPLSLS